MVTTFGRPRSLQALDSFPGQHQPGDVRQGLPGIGQQGQRIELPAINAFDQNKADFGADADGDDEIHAFRGIRAAMMSIALVPAQKTPSAFETRFQNIDSWETLAFKEFKKSTACG